MRKPTATDIHRAMFEETQKYVKVRTKTSRPPKVCCLIYDEKRGAGNPTIPTSSLLETFPTFFRLGYRIKPHVCRFHLRVWFFHFFLLKELKNYVKHIFFCSREIWEIEQWIVLGSITTCKK